MRAAACCILMTAVLAGCGGDDPTPAAQTPAATTTTAPTVRPTPSPTPTARAKRTPRPKPTATPRHPRARRHPPKPPPGAPPLAGAIPRYLMAINARNIGDLCRQFARAGSEPPVCQGQTPPQADSATHIAQVTLRRRPEVVVHGRTAVARVSLALVDDRGRRSARTETLHVRWIGGVWIVARPSRIFFQVTGG